MKFRNYCIVIMGDTKNAVDEIIKISETKPNTLDAKGILICTFSSVAEPRELNDYFKLNNRNFLLFDLNPENSGFNITKPDINDALFGFLKYMDEDNLKHKTNELYLQLTSTTLEMKVLKLPIIKIEDIDNMTMEDKNKLMNELIDKGVENLSDYDKKILSKLAI